MYITRHAERTVEKLSKMFGAVLVAGPRQVGKTTMLKRLSKDFNYVTMDDPVLLEIARAESSTFFKDNPPPVFVDEIQKAPELFTHIKMILDKEGEKGRFYMCGSQQFKMMKKVSESLAGRVGLMTLLGFSLRESEGVSTTLGSTTPRSRITRSVTFLSSIPPMLKNSCSSVTSGLALK